MGIGSHRLSVSAFVLGHGIVVMAWNGSRRMRSAWQYRALSPCGVTRTSRIWRQPASSFCRCSRVAIEWPRGIRMVRRSPARTVRIRWAAGPCRLAGREDHGDDQELEAPPP
jgi:hypothetical protein